jgi:hypothetical protein
MFPASDIDHGAVWTIQSGAGNRVELVQHALEDVELEQHALEDGRR